MYEPNDTITAVSSPASEQRVIIRVSGPDTIKVLRRIFSPSVSRGRSAIIRGRVAVDSELKVDATLYSFPAPRSYTGDDVAEIHVYTNRSVTEVLMRNILGSTAGAVRMAGPGEFTARAYLNGKIDLAQAEAVGEIVASSNRFQLAAAQKLLAGRLGQTIAKAQTDIMDCLSLIEAGLDFSHEDIEFITRDAAVDRLEQVVKGLQKLLSGSITFESVIDLPAVGIAGAPNAGKSSLLNKLLGKARSIVSEQLKTTRDVLSGLLTLKHCSCVLFDCAGLVRTPGNIFDELAQQAATEALRSSAVVVFCVDVSKADYSEDVGIRELIEAKTLIPAATKSDLLPADMLAERVSILNGLFADEFLPVSVRTNNGVELLRDAVDGKLIELTLGSSESAKAARSEGSVALTARHRQAVSEAIESVGESIGELKAGSEEVAAMMLRAAYRALSTIEQANIDEQILERIFQRFCIGK
ncbi:MAG TPA: GTPase [Sedimentisphaerales bacterium]|nr:GTPase [Sedimentisphaerales bacterium]